MNWYLLQTKPNTQTLAQVHLKRQGFEVFLPLLVKTSKKGGKFVDNVKPLFPSYLFIGTELEQIPWKSLNATRGVSKVVTLDGRYRTIGHEIIENIRSRCDDRDVLQTLDEITSGDRVKIEKGPFADFICNVDKITDSKRAWVLIDMLQQKIKAKVAISDLSKVN